MKKILGLTFLITTVVSSFGVVLVNENFGTLTDATPLTSATGTSNGTIGVGTGNTTFSYVRISAATPVLEAQNPSAFTGASGLLSSSSTSLTGVGSSGLSSFDVGTLTFSIRTGATLGASSAFFFGVGTGTTFSGNSTFSSADLLAGYQFLNGQLQVRTGTGAVSAYTSIAGAILAPSTSAEIKVNFNGSASTVTFGTDTVLAGTTDVFINNVLVGDNIDIIDNVTANGVRLYTTTSGSAYELDNVLLDVTVVPEPSTNVMIIGALGLAALVYRRKAGVRL